ncbi:carbohydrate ABC transporter permease [Devosia neptuniae]|uniref:Carbohydrate ABC transporter permease n=1 Tax=Devosia neptuniae TaxID=191302 RepID=A0ABY6CD95_9HYPH|nr:carbohydrate ABC transporter permease [Devosia neptuniae]UXN70203.1 carbohydrate ABC transporter permease [Devosia neptuniae]
MTMDITTARQRARSHHRRIAWLPTIILFIGALYCLMPLYWLVAATSKYPGELFALPSFMPGFSGGFIDNIVGLSNYRGGRYWLWTFNSLLFAVGGASLSTIVSAAAGYGLAKYNFAGKNVVFAFLLGAVLIPGVVLAVPQYLLMSRIGLAGTYWAVLIPSILSPLGIYLCRIYANAVVHDELLEAGRVDGASEGRIFFSIGLAPMIPGLITVFLLQFIGIWNNFLLPFLMLSDERLFPLTVGLYTMLNAGTEQPGMYTFIITGAFLSILPLVALFLLLQRYWRLDLISGSVKG